MKRIALIFVVLAVFVGFNAYGQSVYNILYIQSYTEKDTGSKELLEGLEKGFRENSYSVNITLRYLNSRLLTAEQEEEQMRFFCRDAAERGTDLVVVSHDEALHSLLACGDSLPLQVPVVYFGVEFPDRELMSNFTNLAGTTSPHPYHVMLETAKMVFPERTTVVMVGEDTPLGKAGTEKFCNFWNTFSPDHPEYRLKTYNVTHDPLTDILTDIQISAQAHNSIMIIPYWGLFMSSISKVSRAPTFTLSGTALLNGVFCAFGPNLYNDARNAARIACRIIAGQEPSSIPVTESRHQLTFDYKQLVFFGVGKEQLPRNSVVINESYFNKYGFFIILFYSVLLGFLIFVVVRLVMIYRREARRRIQAQTKLLVQNHLIAQRNEFDHIFHSIRDAVITYDTDFRIHFVNKALLQMLHIADANEYASRPFEGQQAHTLIELYNNGEDILISLLKKVSKEGTSLEIPENSFIKDTNSKNYFPVSGEIVPLYEKNKQTGLVFTFRNISEVAMQKHFFSLAVEESSIYPWQYSRAVDAFVFPANYMNDLGFEGRTLLPREEMNRYIHPDDLEGTTISFTDILDGKKHAARLSFRQKNKNGKYEWWEFRISVLSGLTVDSPYSILGVCQSIQRYKTTEEELIAARDRALQADKLKTAFLANMSHEIRTPLNAIVGFSDLLKNYSIFSESEIKEFVDTINQNCELLLTLINDVLDLSKVEAGSMDFQYSPYYLPFIIQELYDSQKLSMPENVELIQCVPPNSDRTIVTDIVRLKQVLNNLINNAAKFTSEGNIVIGYTEEETYYTTFFVKDTGAGIAQQNLQRIFERFYKVDSFTQGAGLGLSISQTIVTRLRGTIHVTSEEGKGTCFTVRIPNDVFNVG